MADSPALTGELIKAQALAAGLTEAQLRALTVPQKIALLQAAADAVAAGLALRASPSELRIGGLGEIAYGQQIVAQSADLKARGLPDPALPPPK